MCGLCALVRCLECWQLCLPVLIPLLCLLSIAPTSAPPAGDYWPGEAENLLATIGNDALGGGSASHKAGAGGSSRGKPAKGKRVGPATGSTTEELLRRLGDTIQVGGGVGGWVGVGGWMAVQAVLQSLRDPHRGCGCLALCGPGPLLPLCCARCAHNPLLCLLRHPTLCPTLVCRACVRTSSWSTSRSPAPPVGPTCRGGAATSTPIPPRRWWCAASAPLTASTSTSQAGRPAAQVS